MWLGDQGSQVPACPLTPARSGSQPARRHSPQHEPIRLPALGPAAGQAPSGGSCSPQVSLREWASENTFFLNVPKTSPEPVSQPSLALGSSQDRRCWVSFYRWEIEGLLESG